MEEEQRGGKRGKEKRDRNSTEGQHMDLKSAGTKGKIS